MNIYNEDGNDNNDILIAKNWLTKPKKPPLESETPIKANLEEIPRLPTPKSLVSESPSKYLEEKLNQIQQKNQMLTELLNKSENKNNNLKAELVHSQEQNANLQNDLNNLIQTKTQATNQREQIQKN